MYVVWVKSMCLGVGMYACWCLGEVGNTDIFSMVICIMDFFFFSLMSVYYYQFKCF